MTGASREPRIVPFRGEYSRLRPGRASLVRGLIYPVPDPAFPFLGVHFTRRVGGEIWVGPNALLALAKEGYRRSRISVRELASLLRWPGFYRMARRYWRMGLSEFGLALNQRAFIRELQLYVPALQPGDILPAGAGVRAQAVAADGRLLDDLSSHGEYDRTEISLVANSTTYNFRRDALHPPVAPHQPLPGDLIVLWVDPSFNWSHLGTTEVLAASLAADESPTRPAHTTRHFDVPSSQERDSRLAGALMLGIGGLVIGLAALYEWLTERPRRGRPPLARSPGGGRAQTRYLGSRPQPSGDR